MTKKVLFINGPAQEECDQFFGWPTSLLHAIAPTVAAARKGELNIEFISEIFNPVYYTEDTKDEVENEFIRVISSKNPDILCASATYDSVYPVLNLFRKAKQINPDITTILGGPHFDEVHNLQHFNDIRLKPELIDIGIAGDGEFALKETLESLVSGRKLKGINWSLLGGKTWIYTQNGEVYQTNGKPVSLNHNMFMPVELVNREIHEDSLRVFRDGNNKSLPVVETVASRGCPYVCSCCSEGRELAYPNARSIENILEEIYLRKWQGFKAVFFDDSTFGAHPKLKSLLTELSRTGMQFGSLNRFDHLKNQTLVEQYRDAGFTYFYCAIEQLDDGVLEQMHKAQREKTIRDSMDLLQKYEFKIGVSLIYGLPKETERTIAKTIDFTGEFADNGVICLVNESVLSYHPGTALGRVLQKGFHRTPPNPNYPFNQFKEGQWYHPPYVNARYLERILNLSTARFSPKMTKRNHCWHAK